MDSRAVVLTGLTFAVAMGLTGCTSAEGDANQAAEKQVSKWIEIATNNMQALPHDSALTIESLERIFHRTERPVRIDRAACAGVSEDRYRIRARCRWWFRARGYSLPCSRTGSERPAGRVR